MRPGDLRSRVCRGEQSRGQSGARGRFVQGRQDNPPQGPRRGVVTRVGVVIPRPRPSHPPAKHIHWATCRFRTRPPEPASSGGPRPRGSGIGRGGASQSQVLLAGIPGLAGHRDDRDTGVNRPPGVCPRKTRLRHPPDQIRNRSRDVVGVPLQACVIPVGGGRGGVRRRS
ncbi:MAG: hypothetical protein RBG13Loki_0944 [Promethearchaeota archaeon CR_4]|nr:MAG: hypothetical protein RBG13Loki_0944 [Candidatus Lokiarchaeota archaeon CR_4]